MRKNFLKELTLTALPLGLFALFLIYPLLRVFGGVDLLHPPENVFDVKVLESLFNSLLIAFSVSFCCLCVALPTALITTRLRLRFLGVIDVLLMLPLIVPPFVASIGLRRLLAHFGPLNLLLIDVGILRQPIDWLSSGRFSCIVATETLHLYPLLYLSLKQALLQVDGNLTSAAELLGSSKIGTFFKITLPLISVQIAQTGLLIAIWSFTDLGTPLIFEYRDVLPIYLFFSLDEIHLDSQAFWFTLIIILVSTLLFACSAWVRKLGGMYKIGDRVGSVSTRSTPTPVLKVFVLLFITSVIIAAATPHIMIVITSVTDYWGFSIFPERLTLDGFAALTTHPLVLSSIANSLYFASGSAILNIVLGLCIARAVTKASKGILASAAYFLCLSTLAIPGLALAFAYFSSFQGTLIDPRNNPSALLIIGYALRRLPLTVQLLVGAFEQMSEKMLEAAQVLAARGRRTFFTIQLPLLKPYIFAACVTCFVFSMLEVSESLVLAMQEKDFPITKALYALLARPEGPRIACAMGVCSMAILLGVVILVKKLTGKNFIEAADAKRNVLVLIFALIIITPFKASADSKQLVLVSPHWEGLRYEVENGFKEFRTQHGATDEITFVWKDVGATSDILRYIISEFEHTPDGIGVDLMFGGGSDSFSYLKNKGYFSRLEIPQEIKDKIGVGPSGPVIDADGYWAAPQLSGMGIMCNKPVLNHVGLSEPQTWEDLTKPEFKGWLTSADPRKSGSIHFFYETILQAKGWEKGWDLLLRLARNHRAIITSQTQATLDVIAGEAACTFALDSQAWPQKKRFGTDFVHYVIPEDESAINPDAIAVVRGAPQQAIAQEFVRYLLSDDGQKIFYEKKGAPGGPKNYDLARMSVMPAIYTQNLPTYVEINPFSWKSSFRYSPTVGADRWEVMNDLLYVFFVEYSSYIKGADDGTLAQLKLAVPTELEISQLSQDQNWSLNPNRNAVIAQWKKNVRLALHYESSVAEKLVLLLGIFLTIAALSISYKKMF